MRYAYGFDWIPGGIFLGTVLLLLIVPPFALIALAVVALVAVAAVVALAGAILVTPYLLVRTVRRRLAERHESTKRSVPIATAITAIAGPTTARRAQ
jgi:NADH:ubiquinone oxidoreductase subunit 6 (subunit J)